MVHGGELRMHASVLVGGYRFQSEAAQLQICTSPTPCCYRTHRTRFPMWVLQQLPPWTPLQCSMGDGSITGQHSAHFSAVTRCHLKVYTQVPTVFILNLPSCWKCAALSPTAIPKHRGCSKSQSFPFAF